jgi:hypothetical protein
LQQLHPDATDDDHVFVYLIDRNENVAARFRPHQLAPRFQVSTNRRTGLTGCWGADHAARLLRQSGGRILLLLDEAEESN